MTVTKTQLADAYSHALTSALGDEWGCEFSRRDAGKLLEVLWPVVSDLALKDTKKKTPGRCAEGPFDGSCVHVLPLSLEGLAHDREARRPD